MGTCSFCKKIRHTTKHASTQAQICDECAYLSSRVLADLPTGVVRCFKCTQTQEFTCFYSGGSILFKQVGVDVEGAAIYLPTATSDRIFNVKPTLQQIRCTCGSVIPLWFLKYNNYVQQYFSPYTE